MLNKLNYLLIKPEFILTNRNHSRHHFLQLFTHCQTQSRFIIAQPTTNYAAYTPVSAGSAAAQTHLRGNAIKRVCFLSVFFSSK